MYQAIVARLTNVREHPNADKLKLATVQGFQLVVGLDAEEGELGIFFPEDGRVSTDFCLANGLYPVIDPTTNERIGGGFFDPKNNRVRSQAFRGEKSSGYFASLDSVAYTGIAISDLFEGFQFDTLNDQVVCEKYYTPKTLKAMNAAGGVARKVNIMFPKHVDTKKFKYDADMELKPGSIVYLTEKLHGTSARATYALEDVQLPDPWHYRFRRKKNRETHFKKEWTFLLGTRNIVLKDPLAQGFYADEGFRFKAAESLRGNLRKGEVIYSELVGYAGEQGLIMNAQDTSGLKDVKKQYGKSMEYTYGALPGETKQYVYRITQVNEDGDVFELSWPQVKRRCSELGLLTVPELCDPWIIDGVEWTTDEAKITVESLTAGESTLDSRHIREGVVARIEKADGTTSYLKNKSWEFGVLEGYLKNNEDYVDLEEIS